MKKTSIVGAALAVTLVGGAMVAFASPENNENLSASEMDVEAEVYHFRYHAFDHSYSENQVREDVEAIKNAGGVQRLLINGEEVDVADFINGKIELDHTYHNEIEIVDTNGLITTWGI